MLKKLLKILLWFISGVPLLFGLTLFGLYLYFAIPMQKNFARLETTQSADCNTGDYWQIVTPLEDFPPRVSEIFGRFNKNAINIYLTRKIVESMPRRGKLEFMTREVVANLEIKRRYSVQQRFDLSMNHVDLAYRGSCTIQGVTAAAAYYFGKTPAQLSLGETVLLAGLEKSPGFYSPFKHPDNALRRRNQMLEILHNEHLVTDREYQAALTEPLPTVPHFPSEKINAEP